MFYCQHGMLKAGLINENKWYNNLRCNIEITCKRIWSVIKIEGDKWDHQCQRGVLHTFLLQAVPNLVLEYKRLAKEHGLELEQPHPPQWECGLEETGMKSFVTVDTFKFTSNHSKWSHFELLWRGKRFLNYTVISHFQLVSLILVKR